MTLDAPLSRRNVLLTASAAGLVVATAGSSGAAAPRASTAILGGRVYAGPGQPTRHEAIALAADGQVLALGTDAEVRRFVGRRTEVVRARGGTVMSGLVDGHLHPLGAAEQSLLPTLENATYSTPELQATLQGFLDDTSDQEPDGWLQVTDWSPIGVTAHRDVLDALSTARPIYLQGSDFHNSWVNTRALELAGIPDSTPNPPGGEIVRDTEGHATGLLIDEAQGLVKDVIPPPSEAELIAAYEAMVEYLLSLGITSWMDAVAGPSSLASYAALKASGKLPQRVTPALTLSDELLRDPDSALDYLRQQRRDFKDSGLDLTTVKLFVDGVIEFPAQTAALIDPYLDADGQPTDNRGDLYLPRAVFNPLAVALDRAGWQLHCHALGDRAVRVSLDAIAAARRANGPRRGLRHTLAHLQLVHPQDYARFARLDVLACMQLQWAERNEWTLDALKPYIGRERFRRMYPANSLRRAGARLTGGSDWPVDPLAPMNQIATAIDRLGPGPDREPLNPWEGISRGASLAMHTRGAAYQLHGSSAGMLKQGRRADVIVLDRDLRDGPVGSIRRATVQQTVIGGRIRYDADTASPARGAAFARVTGGQPHQDCCGR